MDKVKDIPAGNETIDMAFIGIYSDCPSAEQGPIASHTKLKQGNQERTINVSEPQKEALLLSSSSVSKSAALVESSSLVESPQTGNLTVRIEKEKGRRRRKKTRNYDNSLKCPKFEPKIMADGVFFYRSRGKNLN
uniref:Uncharacterized protein n=1 Tax=Nelumbo nucifera TaxID=4432 RepID=A0A822YFY1_NELNU|nr:TPA_asm: hypothetical protein HUJ06_010247 [Nelumbo nucifera]